MKSAPQKQGLYDPQFEHDACGIGSVVDIKGRKSHAIVKDALTVLKNLDHRGACGCEVNTGDGAGILFQIPHGFFVKRSGVTLPEPGLYGVGMFSFPREADKRADCERRFEELVRKEGQEFLGWRDVPTRNDSLGATAKAGEPVVRQAFIKMLSGTGADELRFERKLYVIRKLAEHSIKVLDASGSNRFYIPSLSTRTIVYKGMLLSHQMEDYFPDLVDPDLESAIALVHSRFSTNTFPNWNRAHPYRYIIHNGEINTLRGNINWMAAREKLCQSELFGKDLKRLLPVIDTDGSDSAMFDNVLEFLVMGGRSLPHAMMMMIPEPWENHRTMDPARKAFYEFHNCLIEPWDGPASVAFTDGIVMGATLDRNGLRPSRYYITADDRLILASEAGVLDVPSSQVVKKGRLQPGRMLLVDTREGRIIADDEIKAEIVAEHPYRDWLEADRVPLDHLPDVPEIHPADDREAILRLQRAFGYTYEDLRVFLEPMAKTGVDPIGAMGTDTPLSVLSDKPCLLYSYFKQLFAQVTNPPIDAIREEIITSGETTIGSEGNLLKPTPESCRMIELHSPILTNEELEKLRGIKRPGFKAVTLPILFEAGQGKGDAGKVLEKALNKLFSSADQAIRKGANVLVLSDKGVTAKKAPIPALLASAALHHHLIRKGTRTKVGIILESGEPREAHHMAVLIGYGVAAVNPWLAFESLDRMIADGMLAGTPYKAAVKKYCKGLHKGVIKVISKMGLSTIQAYRGAQIFEALGLSQKVVDRYFTWTASRIGGVGLSEIAREALLRHAQGFPPRPGSDVGPLDAGGQYKWRKDGERHLFNPESIYTLQTACRTGDYDLFKKYASLINDQSRELSTLRGLLEFKKDRSPVPLEEVESVESITKRFKSGAMSYGSISQEAHETLAIAMNRVGGRSNTGEGGEDPARYTALPNGDSKNSAIKQVASGRFGVTSHYLVNAKELQIKMAQGAKPGEGGQLPGAKVYPWVAKTRHTTAGVGLISPPPHHDIYSIEDLAELIHDLKNANHHARISVKLVSEVGVGTVAAGVAKAHADVVLISGYDGGTGASPQTSIKNAGLPWELGLAETHQTLVLNKLRSRIVIETDGQMKTGRDVVVAALLGAEEFGFATAPLVVMGCVMMRVCHQNTCSVGVATQDPALRAKFSGKPDHVVNFMRFVAQEARELMASLGFRSINEMVGHSEVMEARKAVDHWKAKNVDLSPILYRPEAGPEVGLYCTETQDHGLDKGLDLQTLLSLCSPALERGEKVTGTVAIKNFHRVAGTMTGSELTRRHGPKGLPEDTIDLTLQGSAGQSFGAFVPPGMTLRLEGDANDYFGKGLSGGKLIVTPPADSSFVPEENVIIGNVAFYGATSGQAYIRGLAGERFCVRNSGVHAVVEGVGDHGCEYMTGGRVVVLGKTGRNFGAGMSGGVAYVWDEAGTFAEDINREMVDPAPLEPGDLDELLAMIQLHHRYTKSERAKKILDSWTTVSRSFVKVLPRDYKRMLDCIKRAQESGLSGENAIMAAFEENAKDLSRVGGS